VSGDGESAEVGIASAQAVAHELAELDDSRVGDAITDGHPHAALGDDPVSLEERQVLAGVGRARAGELRKLGERRLAGLLERIEKAEAGCIAEQTKAASGVVEKRVRNSHGLIVPRINQLDKSLI
jgi:hypothetical protein